MFSLYFILTPDLKKKPGNDTESNPLDGVKLDRPSRR